jgi:sphingoid base N-palmitoyltransferase
MFLHHIITIILVCYSYLTNFTRIGSLILVLHDGADFWLELAKAAKYANLQRLCDSAFIIFALVWFITRLVVFPIKY